MRIFRRKHRAADGSQVEAPTWWVRFSVRGRAFEESLRTRDRRAAELLAGELVRKAERRAAGLTDPFEEHRERPIAEHLNDFETTLRARGAGPKHLLDRMRCLGEFAGATHAKRIDDFNEGRASAWLDELRRGGKLSNRSINRRTSALMQFGRWCVKNRRTQFDPFVTLRLLNQDEDRHYERRALSPEEFGRLIDAALKDAEKGGRARALCYLLAAGTGLRRGELERLTWDHLDLEVGRAIVSAASAKARKEQVVELNANLLATLRTLRPTAPAADARVLPPGAIPRGDKMREDLERAKIPHWRPVEPADATDGADKKPKAERDGATVAAAPAKDPALKSDLVVDLHSLRRSFITWLSQTGTHPKTTQSLARHSTIDLTMNVYSDVRVVDQRAAVDRLPIPALEPVAPLSPILPLVQRPLPGTVCTSLPDDEEDWFETDSATDAEDCVGSGVSDGTPGRTRTSDLRFRKPLL